MLTSLLCQAAWVSSGREDNTLGHGKCVNTEMTCLVRWSQVISSHCGFYCLTVPEPSIPNRTHTPWPSMRPIFLTLTLQVWVGQGVPKVI